MYPKGCKCVERGFIDNETGLPNHSPEKVCGVCRKLRAESKKQHEESNALYESIKKEHPDWGHYKIKEEFKKRGGVFSWQSKPASK